MVAQITQDIVLYAIYRQSNISGGKSLRKNVQKFRERPTKVRGHPKFKKIYIYSKIFMNFDNKIQNDFWARDRTRALWAKSKRVSHSDMGQITIYIKNFIKNSTSQNIAKDNDDFSQFCKYFEVYLFPYQAAGFTDERRRFFSILRPSKTS